jgi:hypothetical protein
MNSQDINHFSNLLNVLKDMRDQSRQLLYISTHCNDTIRKFFYYALSKNHSFGVSKDECLLFSGTISDFHEYDNVFEMFDSIIEKSLTSHKAICGVIMGVADNLSYEDKETLLNIIDGDLGLGFDNYELNVSLGLGYWDDWFIEDYDEVLFKQSKYSHNNKYEELVA